MVRYKKRGERERVSKRQFYFVVFSLFVLLGVLIFLLFFFLGQLYSDLSTSPGDTTWRSAMFPANWQPIDKIGPVEGVNIFTDPKGMKDQNGNTVTSGPLYHPKRFLHDFSYAGYHSGEKPIPPEDPNAWTKAAKVYNVVTQYGCVADGKMDCRGAIQNAIDAAGKTSQGGIIYLPAGEYRITARNDDYFLVIRNSSIVLRGDGPDNTKIKVDPYFNGVFDMNSKRVITTKYGNPVLDWTDAAGSSVKITKDLIYPTKTIPVASASTFKIGDPLIIDSDWTDAFIREHDMVGVWTVGAESAYVLRRKVTGVDTSKNEITIDVPTRYRIKLTDNPVIYKTNRGISEIGIEHLSFGMIRHPNEWPASDPSLPIVQALKGNELIHFDNVENGWIYDIKSYTPAENVNRPTDNLQFGKYNVEILNNVLYLYQSRFITVKNFYFKNMQVDGNPGGGHGYAMHLFQTNDVLIENGMLQKIKKGFTFNQGGASGNVIKDVVVKEVFTTQNDFHSFLSAANLLDNNHLQGTYWEAAIRPLDPPTSHGQGTTESVFWNTEGTHLTIPILDYWDRDNDDDNKRDELESHGAFPDEGIIVSSQYGWGYIIGTYGAFSNVITARVADRLLDLNGNGKDYDDDPFRPYTLPEDYHEGIGYDKDPQYAGKVLEPRSLYEAQLALRLGQSPPTGCVPTTEVCDGIDNDCDGAVDENVKTTFYVDGDRDGFGGTSSTIGCSTPSGYVTNNQDCNDSDYSAHISLTCIYDKSKNQCGAFSLCIASCPSPPVEICGNGIDEDCSGKDDACGIVEPTLNVSAPESSVYSTRTVPLVFSSTNAFECWYEVNGVRYNLTSCNYFGYLKEQTAGDYVIRIVVKNNIGQEEEERRFSIIPLGTYRIKYQSFYGKGATTDLSQLKDSDLESVSLILDDGVEGSVAFLDPVNLTDSAGPNKEIDLDSLVNISFAFIEVKGGESSTFQKKALIRFYGISFASPRLLRDGVVCDANVCVRESYENGSLVYTVPGFSTYKVEEGASPPDDGRGTTGGGGGGGVRDINENAPDGVALVNQPQFQKVKVNGSIQYFIVSDGETVILQIGLKNVSVVIDVQNGSVVLYTPERYPLLLEDVLSIQLENVPVYFGIKELNVGNVVLAVSFKEWEVKSVLFEEVSPSSGIIFALIFILILIAGVLVALYYFLKSKGFIFSFLWPFVKQPESFSLTGGFVIKK